MNTSELIDLNQRYGGPVESAIVTGRGDEIIACLEKEIEKDNKYLDNAVEREDAISVILYKDSIVKTREVIERIKEEVYE